VNKRKLDRGEVSGGMTAARVAKLEVLGFVWELSAAAISIQYSKAALDDAGWAAFAGAFADASKTAKKEKVAKEKAREKAKKKKAAKRPRTESSTRPKKQARAAAEAGAVSKQKRETSGRGTDGRDGWPS
jgi:hypothetical protein